MYLLNKSHDKIMPRINNVIKFCEYGIDSFKRK